MSNMESQSMGTDTFEERLNDLEKRVAQLEAGMFGFDEYQRLNLKIDDVAVKLGLEIDDLKEMIKNR